MRASLDAPYDGDAARRFSEYLNQRTEFYRLEGALARRTLLGATTAVDRDCRPTDWRRVALTHEALRVLAVR